MSQQINDNFKLLAALPLDDRYRQATVSSRDLIPPTRRYEGLISFVDQTSTLYMLIGGIENANWKGIAGADTSNDIETIIEGFYVLLAGKETQYDWEVNDKFRGWIGNRYVVGTILSLPVSLPTDTDNNAKVTLAFDSNGFSPSLTEQIEFTALGGETSHDIGTTSLVKSWFWDGSPQAKSQWTQTGSVINFAFPLSSGSFNIFI